MKTFRFIAETLLGSIGLLLPGTVIASTIAYVAGNDLGIFFSIILGLVTVVAELMWIVYRIALLIAMYMEEIDA